MISILPDFGKAEPSCLVVSQHPDDQVQEPSLEFRGLVYKAAQPPYTSPVYRKVRPSYSE